MPKTTENLTNKMMNLEWTKYLYLQSNIGLHLYLHQID